MEQALCDVLKDVRIGKILIQTNRETDEPEVRTYFLSKLKKLIQFD
jgi:uridine kinase